MNPRAIIAQAKAAAAESIENLRAYRRIALLEHGQDPDIAPLLAEYKDSQSLLIVSTDAHAKARSCLIKARQDLEANLQEYKAALDARKDPPDLRLELAARNEAQRFAEASRVAIAEAKTRYLTARRALNAALAKHVEDRMQKANTGG